MGKFEGPFGVPTPERVFADYEEKQRKKEREELSTIMNSIFNPDDDIVTMFLNNKKLEKETYKEGIELRKMEAENRREELNIRRIEAENENLRLKLELKNSKSHLINPIIRI